MKILHIITGLGDGGAEGVLYRLITQDSNNTHQVISLTQGGKYEPMLRAQGIDVTCLSLSSGKMTFSSLRQLWKLVRRSKSDVVQTWMYHADLIGGLVARLAGIPVVWGIRNTALEAGRSSRSTIWTARICAHLSRWIPKQIIVCAQGASKVHAQLGYDQNRMIIIPNGYDVSRFAPDTNARKQLRTDWNTPDQQPVIGMVARLDPYKDHANLFSALQIVARSGINFKCILAGTGMNAQNTALVSLIENMQLSSYVSLLGPRNDIPAVMNALDIHALSSSSEAFPNVLAEAMACGTPCVTTDVGDAALIVGKTGWVVLPQDAQALAQGILQTIQAWRETASWSDRQTQCRNRIVETFSLQRMLNRYQQVWEEVRKKPTP